jgi:hypothetical protein
VSAAGRDADAAGDADGGALGSAAITLDPNKRKAISTNESVQNSSILLREIIGHHRTGLGRGKQVTQIRGQRSEVSGQRFAGRELYGIGRG